MRSGSCPLWFVTVAIVLIAAMSLGTVTALAQAGATHWSPPKHTAQLPPQAIATPLPVRLRTEGPALNVSLDGRFLGPVALARNSGPPLITVISLATALQWKFLKTLAGAHIDDGTGTRAIRVGSRFVREDGSDVALFTEPAVERNGRVMIALNDAATLFALTVTSTRGTIALKTETLSQGAVSIAEVARPATARPKSTPRPAPTTQAMNELQGAAGQVLLTLEQDGNSRTYRAGVQANSAFLRANVLSIGSSQELGPPLGSITIGGVSRNASLGAAADPISGVIIRNGLFNGVDVHDARAANGIDLLVGRRFGDGRTMLAASRTAVDGRRTDVIAIATHRGRYDQTLLRHSETGKARWGTVTRELLVSERGIGAGITTRSAGRTFVESTTTFASAGLPVGENDVPNSLAIGRTLSPAATLSAGMFATRGTSISPYLGLSVRGSTTGFSVNASAHSVSGSLSYRSERGYLQLFASPGVNRLLAAQGALLLPAAQVDMNVATEGGVSNSSVQFRTIRRGLNLVAGASRTTGQGVRPLAGITVPITRSFSLEAIVKPGATGTRSAVSLSLIAGIARRRPHVVTFPLNVRLHDVEGRGPFRLFVDGAPILRFGTDLTTVNVLPGRHEVSVESVDGRFGSLSHSIDSAGPLAAEFTILEQRTIRGRVRFDAPAALLAPELLLAGIVLVVEPGNASVETDAEGTFVFPHQPFDPNAVLSVDPDTLPRGFAAPAPIAIGNDRAIDIPLKSAVRVERQIFK